MVQLLPWIVRDLGIKNIPIYRILWELTVRHSFLKTICYHIQKTLVSNTHIYNTYNVRCGAQYLTALLGNLEDSMLKAMHLQSAWKM